MKGFRLLDWHYVFVKVGECHDSKIRLEDLHVI